MPAQADHKLAPSSYLDRQKMGFAANSLHQTAVWRARQDGGREVPILGVKSSDTLVAQTVSIYECTTRPESVSVYPTHGNSMGTGFLRCTCPQASRGPESSWHSSQVLPYGRPITDDPCKSMLGGALAPGMSPPARSSSTIVLSMKSWEMRKIAQR